MRDYFLSDAEVHKPTLGWNSFQLWKTTAAPTNLDRHPRTYGQRMDDEEDRLLIRRRKLERLAFGCLRLLLGSLSLLLWFAWQHSAA